MAIVNVSSLTGSDTLGSGTNASPFKSVARAVSHANPGDIILILGADGHVHEEPDTVLIDDKINIKIQTEPLRHVIIRPKRATQGATFKIINSAGINVSGLIFMSAFIPETPGSVGNEHANAIFVQNSSEIKILGNEISRDWECHNVAKTELFKCDNSSAEITGNFCEYIENSYPALNANNFFSFISLSGNGDYLVKNNAVKNVHSNSSYAYGIKIYPDCSKFVIDDFEASNFIDAHVDYHDKMIGIKVEFDNSPPEYEIKNVVMHDLGYGIYFDHAIRSNKITIKKLLIYNCEFAAIMLDNESIIHSTRNITIVNCGQGIYAKTRSGGEFHNCILFQNETALRSEIESNITLKYSVYYRNTEFKFVNNNATIDTSQFVRNIDPRFVNESENNFELTDYSPCVDTGYLFPGDDYMGSGPDMGYFEKTALITEDDLPALLARATRMTEIVPLTEIDIIGMVAKGIETSDGRILASREGSAIKDLAVKPLDLIMSPYHTELELIRERLAFDRLENLSQEDADLLASNVFVYRNYGTRASGIIRIYFSEPTDSIIYAEHEFRTRNNYKFYNRATISITKDEMLLNYDNGAYYYDIVVDAEVPDSLYNMPANSITLSTMPMPPGTLNFTNPYEITGGATAESNYALKEKARWAITVRDIVTKKGAKATLPEMFPVISDMRTIGYRDPEMERDYIDIIDDHIGGKSDVYIKTRKPVEDSKIIYPDGKYFEITDARFSGYVPILKINSIELLEPVSESETGIFLMPVAQYNILSRDSWTRFSVKESIAIEFSDSVVADYMPNTPFKINFTWVPEMKAIQRVVDGDVERVVVADFMIRAFEPVFISFSMSYLAETELPELEESLRGFIRGIPAGFEVQVSDLIAIAYSVGAQKVLQPMEISAERHARNGDILLDTSPDSLIVPRICTFWDGDITVNYLGKDNYASV